MSRVRVVAAACTLATVAACSAPQAPPPPQPTSPPASASASATPTATATTTPGIDLLAPGAARSAVTRLTTAAGSTEVLMLAITATDASVTVLVDGAAKTWALRGGEPRVVQSDTTYVSQASFYIGGFDLSDVGALFRAAAAVSGSTSRQELHIVDYSGGLVMMSVSTNPESRTVFFHPDGRLLETLDFDEAWGLERGFADAVGSRAAVHAVGFGSQAGVFADVPGITDATVNRRQRTARVPVVVSSRADANPPPLFSPSAVDPDAVAGVIESLRRQGTLATGQEWTCVVDDRERRGVPRMYFQAGATRLTTDLAGVRVDG